MNGSCKKIFFIDAGRKYFPAQEIREILDEMAANDYDALELALGNGGIRLLLDDMSLQANGRYYSSESVAEALREGNRRYMAAALHKYEEAAAEYGQSMPAAGSGQERAELTQEEMDEIISYAADRHIDVIPLVNSPGHMDAILSGMELLGIEHAACAAEGYGVSACTANVSDPEQTGFLKALVRKYIQYFAGKGCRMFNLGADEFANDIFVRYPGMGFGYLLDQGRYGDFISYINDLAALVRAAGMIPEVFNDGIYYGENDSQGRFDPQLVISYWTEGWGGYRPASAAFLAEKGHCLINSNGCWYYVLGRVKGAAHDALAVRNVEAVSCDRLPGEEECRGEVAAAKVCVWCDEPYADYALGKPVVMEMIREFAAANRELR